MKTSTRKWITKAEEDFAIVNVLTRQRKKPLGSPVCFHAQQRVGKNLKARLNVAALAIHRTHDLEQLLNHILPIEPLWAAFLPVLKRLRDAAVVPRYPGSFTTKTEAQRALQTCKSFRKEARSRLGLPVK